MEAGKVTLEEQSAPRDKKKLIKDSCLPVPGWRPWPVSLGAAESAESPGAPESVL